MIAAATTTVRTGPRRASRAPITIPDIIIRVYFALFPALVALFLGVQAVRAQIPDVDVAPSAPISVQAH